MSSTNRGRERVSDDVYETPPWAVHVFLNEVELPAQGRWFEPCAGSGAIIRASRVLYPEVSWTANELRPECEADLITEVGKNNVTIGDFLTNDFPSVDVVITNPPFSLAMEFIAKSMSIAPITVMLVRLNFLESIKRAEFFRKHCPDVYVLSKRPSFVYGRTDSTGYCWAVFHQAPRESGKIMVLYPPKDGLYAHKNRKRRDRVAKAILPEDEIGEGATSTENTK